MRKRRRNGTFKPGKLKGSEAPKVVMPPANPEYAKAMQELRASSAASPHQDKRTKRVRTRAAALRRSLDDQ